MERGGGRLQLCESLSEREDWTRTRGQEDQAENIQCRFSTANLISEQRLFFKGHLSRRNRGDFFSGEEVRETDKGREGRGERERKLFLLQNLKAVLQIWTHLCYKMKWKGQECGPCLPNEKLNCSDGFFFFLKQYVQNTL